MLLLLRVVCCNLTSHFKITPVPVHLELDLTMRFTWPSVVFSLLINLSLQVDGSGQEKQPTSSVQLNARDDESTQELYSIYPKDVTIKSQADAINALLDRVVTNKTSIYASELNLDNTWTLFWNARMTESQADIIRKDPNVSSYKRPKEERADLAPVGRVYWEIELIIRSLHERSEYHTSSDTEA